MRIFVCFAAPAVMLAQVEDFMIYSSLAVQHRHPTWPAFPEYTLFLLLSLTCLISSATLLADFLLSSLLYTFAWLIIALLHVCSQAIISIATLAVHLHATPWREEGQCSPLNHRHLTLSSVTHLTGANHFSANGDLHVGLIFKSLFIIWDSSGGCRVTLMKILKIISRYQ